MTSGIFRFPSFHKLNQQMLNLMWTISTRSLALICCVVWTPPQLFTLKHGLRGMKKGFLKRGKKKSSPYETEGSDVPRSSSEDVLEDHGAPDDDEAGSDTSSLYDMVSDSVIRLVD